LLILFKHHWRVTGAFLPMNNQPQVLACLFGNFSSAFNSPQETNLQKIQFDHILKGVSFFAE
jgi:hypothetical protein